jgi:transformer-2 protein
MTETHEEYGTTNLFVTGLLHSVGESDLETLFATYGKVSKVHIMRDPHEGVSRGFGFVNFDDKESAEKALHADGELLHGKPLIVQPAKRQRARTPTPGQYRGPIKDRREPRRDDRRERDDRDDRRDDRDQRRDDRRDHRRDDRDFDNRQIERRFERFDSPRDRYPQSDRYRDERYIRPREPIRDYRDDGPRDRFDDRREPPRFRDEAPRERGW